MWDLISAISNAVMAIVAVVAAIIAWIEYKQHKADGEADFRRGREAEAALVEVWVAKHYRDNAIIIANRTNRLIRNVHVEVQWPDDEVPGQRYVGQEGRHIAPGKDNKSWSIISPGAWQVVPQKGGAPWKHPALINDDAYWSPNFGDPHYMIIAAEFTDSYGNIWRREYASVNKKGHLELHGGDWRLKDANAQLR